MSQDPKAAFLALSFPEKLLGGAAAVGLIGWFCNTSIWHSTFGKLAIFGMVGVVAIVGMGLAGVNALQPAQRRMGLIIAGLLPAGGILIDALRHFTSGLIMLGALAMAGAVGLMTGKVSSHH